MDSVIKMILDAVEEVSGFRLTPEADFSFLDSLEYTELLLEIEKRCGKQLPKGVFPETVKELAEELGKI